MDIKTQNDDAEHCVRYSGGTGRFVIHFWQHMSLRALFWRRKASRIDIISKCSFTYKKAQAKVSVLKFDAMHSVSMRAPLKFNRDAFSASMYAVHALLAHSAPAHSARMRRQRTVQECGASAHNAFVAGTCATKICAGAHSAGIRRQNLSALYLVPVQAAT